MSTLIVEVCKVDESIKHPNADRLSIVIIKGWNCITGLNDFKKGDLVIFIPPDCIIPERIIDEYKLTYLKKNGRTGTVKLRGEISQGLILPISILDKYKLKNIKDGLNVAEVFGITKYEPPSPRFQSIKRKTLKDIFIMYREGKITLRRFIFKSIGLIRDRYKKKKNINPLFYKYTDIENIKHYPNLFEDGEHVVITEKIHGTNFRSGYLPVVNPKFWNKNKYEFVYGSHNMQITGHRGRKCFYGEDVYGIIAERYNLAKVIPEDCIIYGEIYGKGIQKNYNYGLIDDIDIVFFDVKKDGKYLDWKDFILFCKKFGLPRVPVLSIGKYNKNDIEKCTSGGSLLCLDHKIREGCVVRSAIESNKSIIGRKILKSINPEYLLLKDNTEFH